MKFNDSVFAGNARTAIRQSLIEKAAKAMHFTPKVDNTPQWGTITYVFKIPE